MPPPRPCARQGGAMLSFGVTVLPDPPYGRMIELMQLAERHGFEHAWTYDSHILWQESYATLAVAGRVADGVIIQLADPQIVEWIMDTARRAAEEAGRDPSELKCIVGAPSHISDDLADAREQVRWFPAMVSNHVMDLIERYGF